MAALESGPVANGAGNGASGTSTAADADAETEDPAGEDDADMPVETGPEIQPERPEALTRPRSGGGDDLTAIDGIGPRIQEALNSLGIFHYDQIAAWTGAHEAWIDEDLSFSGRVARERWVAQAKALLSD